MCRDLGSGSEDEVFDYNKTGVEWGQAKWRLEWYLLYHLSSQPP